MNNFLNEKINWGVALTIITIAFIIILIIMFKYKNEGEQNLPFNLSRILIVSSAEAESGSEETESKWNLSINQYNDVYLNFEKNPQYEKNDYIEKITIENITINQKPEIGNFQIFMPSGLENEKFSYEDTYLVKDSLTYNGGLKDNPKTLEIERNGGTIIFRIANRNVGKYISDEDAEIAYDGTLLKKANIDMATIKASVTFDIVVTTNRTAYRTSMTVDVPGEGIQDTGVVQKRSEDYIDLVFKRERK